MSTPIVYRSSDASAPVLHGNAGDLITVLDACLVNGYTGKAAAGWTKSFSGTAAASYRQGGGCLFYLDVNDNNPNVTSTGKEAAVRGYEAMTALATGTNAFPTTAQIAAPGLRVRKSSTADNTNARAWVVIADDRTLWMAVLTNDVSGAYFAWGFGDFYSFKTGDAYKCFIKAGNTMNSLTVNGDIAQTNIMASVVAGFYVPRTSAGTGTSVNMTQLGLASTVGSGPPFPNPPDSNLYLSRYLMTEGAVEIRGYLRGPYQILNNSGVTMTDKDTFSGTGDLAGRTFVVIGKDASNVVYYCIETTAWDTSA